MLVFQLIAFIIGVKAIHYIIVNWNKKPFTVHRAGERKFY